MGILRTDRITGLGGANAITGSVEFHGEESQDDLQLLPSSDFNFGTGDYTIEAWVYPVEFGRSQMIFAVHNSDSTVAAGKFYFRSTNKFSYWSQNLQATSSTTYTESKWYHVALVNNSGTQTIYVDGTSQATSTYSSGFGRDDFVVNIGRNAANTGQSFNGFISNIRVTKGTALYTGTFTPPTTRLAKRSDTVLLACNSASNVLNEETGKVIQSVTASTNNSGPVASKFTPNSPVGFSTTSDVGSQYGSTFNGFGNFATSTYMVPPGGNTRERNRGRALFGGGSTIDNTIQSLSIQSQGNTEDFGDLSTGRYETECASSSTRGIWGGGYTESPNVKVDVIEFVTIANSSNTTDFGNLTVARGHLAGMCNSTRGVFANGSTDPGPNVNTLDYITIATAGNATDFGDSTTASKPMGGGRSSTTRGIFTLGNAPSAVNNIEYITIASTGDSQDFGDLTGFSGWGKGAGNISSGTRAILGGGHEALNNIEYITIASLGNGTDFGDLIVGRRSAFTAGSKTRGVFGGGKNPSQLNSIEYVEIATTGNALDFGDMINSKSFSSGLSDCHGGLS